MKSLPMIQTKALKSIIAKLVDEKHCSDLDFFEDSYLVIVNLITMVVVEEL